MYVSPKSNFQLDIASTRLKLIHYLGTVSANDALTISLVRPGISSNIETITSFNPRFTYPLFGEEEHIFGYKGLKINLKYDARDLRPNLTISYARKYTTVGDVEALDIKEKLKEFLPAGLFSLPANALRLLTVHSRLPIKERVRASRQGSSEEMGSSWGLGKDL